MALESSDVFVVQKQSGGQEIYKATLESVAAYLDSQGGITYRGTIDLTQVPGGQLDPATPVNGDLYINTGDGVAAAGYEGITAGADVSDGDRIIYVEPGHGFDLIPTTGNSGVEEVQAALPLTVDANDSSAPIISSTEATTTSAGHVARLATAADVAASTGSGASDAVVTADLLKTTNDALDAATAGGVSAIIGVDPIEVFTGSNGGSSTSPAVGVKDATDTQKGVVTLASSADITNGTAGKVVTADQLDAATADLVQTVTGVAPIQVDEASVTGESKVSVDAASQSALGVVKLADATDLTTPSTTAVVTADQLKDAVESVEFDLQSEDGTITIDTATEGVTKIDVTEGLYLLADFSSYPDISTAP